MKFGFFDYCSLAFDDAAKDALINLEKVVASLRSARSQKRMFVFAKCKATLRRSAFDHNHDVAEHTEI